MSLLLQSCSVCMLLWRLTFTKFFTKFPFLDPFAWMAKSIFIHDCDCTYGFALLHWLWNISCVKVHCDRFTVEFSLSISLWLPQVLLLVTRCWDDVQPVSLDIDIFESTVMNATIVHNFFAIVWLNGHLVDVMLLKIKLHEVKSSTKTFVTV